jgi:hypothetical protein
MGARGGAGDLVSWPGPAVWRSTALRRLRGLDVYGVLPTGRVLYEMQGALFTCTRQREDPRRVAALEAGSVCVLSSGVVAIAGRTKTHLVDTGLGTLDVLRDDDRWEKL